MVGPRKDGFRAENGSGLSRPVLRNRGLDIILTLGAAMVAAPATNPRNQPQ